MSSEQAVDLTNELGKLLNYIGRIGVTIRMLSAYAGHKRGDEESQLDLMWLSDALHHFEHLGKALCSRDNGNIIRACGYLTEAYKGYSRTDTGMRSEPKPTFDRHNKHFTLQEGLEIFQSIMEKVSQSIPKNLERNQE